jgi:hypothetical protein
MRRGEDSKYSSPSRGTSALNTPAGALPNGPVLVIKDMGPPDRRRANERMGSWFLLSHRTSVALVGACHGSTSTTLEGPYSGWVAR